VRSNDWHHYDFGDYRIGVTRIEDDPGSYALLFVVDDTAYPLAYYPNEDAAQEAMRVLDAGMGALREMLERRKRPAKKAPKKPAAKPAKKALKRKRA
jgi:hypothetical protein